MIKLGWVTDDSAHAKEKLTKWADWEYNMFLLNIYMLHRGQPPTASLPPPPPQTHTRTTSGGRQTGLI